MLRPVNGASGLQLAGGGLRDRDVAGGEAAAGHHSSGAFSPVGAAQAGVAGEVATGRSGWTTAAAMAWPKPTPIVP